MMKKCLAFVLSLSVIGNSLFLGNVEAKVEKETLSNKSYQIKSMMKNIAMGVALSLYAFVTPIILYNFMTPRSANNKRRNNGYRYNRRSTENIFEDSEFWKKFYENFNSENFSNFNAINEVPALYLSDEILGELKNKLNEILGKFNNLSYSSDQGEELFNWVHQNIIKSNNTISFDEKLDIKVRPNDAKIFNEIFRIIKMLDSKTRTNDKSLHTLFGEFNKIKKSLLIK